MTSKRALLVGIESVPVGGGIASGTGSGSGSEGGSGALSVPLEGTANDIKLFQRLLPLYGFQDSNVLTLLNEAATREAILGHLKGLVEQTGPSDVALFAFFGHGDQMPNEQKPNGYTETIVPYDARLKPNVRMDIRDDEILAILEKANSNNITLIFDCCHAADITRDIPFKKHPTFKVCPDC